MDLKLLRGVNDGRVKDLNKLGIYTLEGLIKYYPRNYFDLTKITPLGSCYHNEMALLYAKVVSSVQVTHARKNLNFSKVICEQNGEPFTAIWFNQPYVKNYIKSGETYIFYGRIQNKYGAVSIVNPIYENAENNRRLKGLLPVYKVGGSISQKIMQSLILSALKIVEIRSIIPQNVAVKYGIGDYKSAMTKIHAPTNEKEKDLSSKRIALEEYFILISAFKIFKGGSESLRINNYTVKGSQLAEFTKRFPFELTSGQKNSLNEIYNDLQSPRRMNRLLQGDVGSGKTAVALSAIYMAVASGYQACMLAPTEVLAHQNFALLKEYFPEYRVEFLVGGATAKNKRLIKDALKKGEIDILCGTHAVIQDDVEYKNLALCVCDEQHRFGVAQRASLADKGKGADMLVMSATPIPRTLSLIVYGDLDISTIPDKPVGRLDVKTLLVPAHKREDMLSYIREQIESGQQCYFVCPKIEDDPDGTVESVKEVFEELTNKLPTLKLSLLHGKMKDSEKQSVMQDFKDGKTHALVSTTVIEVGIDVKNATLMTIFGAERFGLSQLHQLRGRIGRGDLQSYCFLLADMESQKALERLTLFKSTADGFKIAEYDYQLRGGGDFLGTRQSGKFFGEIKNLHYTIEDIELAKKLSDEAFDGGYNLKEINQKAEEKYQQLKNIVLN